jgi:hypothetical protein
VKVASSLVLHRVHDVDQFIADEGRAGIAGLTTHLGVKWRLIENEKGVLVRRNDIHQFGLGDSLGVAEKLAGFEIGSFSFRRSDENFLLLGSPAALALSLHQFFELYLVYRESSLSGKDAGHI